MSPREENNIAVFKKTISPILDHYKVREMDIYIQHRKTTCLKHCLYVSWVSWRIANKMTKSPAEVARGALLHDFFLYDWHEGNHEGMHAFSHPKKALKNADCYFKLTPREKDIIKNHMWPATILMPKFATTFIVIAVDKYCAVMDTFGWNKRFISIQDQLLEKDKAS